MQTEKDASASAPVVGNDDVKHPGTGAPSLVFDSQSKILQINHNNLSWKINGRSFDIERQGGRHSASLQDVDAGVFAEGAFSNWDMDGGKVKARPPLPSESDPPIKTEQPEESKAFPMIGSRVSMDQKSSSMAPSLPFLCLGALGAVYGDIGTSPLYTVQIVFAAGTIPVDEDHVIGAISALFWLLNIMVTLKYLSIVLLVNNNGEGGVVALTTLVTKSTREASSSWWKEIITVAGIFAATMFYGDAMITPALSVMSAIEGCTLVWPNLTGKTMPIAVAILVVLFMVQRFGTGKVGKTFGPIMIVYFLTLAITGIQQIIAYPGILQALNPARAVSFLNEQSQNGQLLGILGNLILVITGGEATYADIGHFGAKAVRYAWYFFALPCLCLNYLGQGAIILSRPETVSNPYYYLFPDQYLIPALILSTMATVIASQAVITGCFSITSQSMKMDFWPRMEVRHKSRTEHGMIYIPLVNWILMIAVVILCVSFQISTNLSNAYGMAVSLTMSITTILMLFYGRCLLKDGWHYWALIPIGILMTGIAAIDVLLVCSCAGKFLQGAWFPIALGLVMFVLMSTWRRGMVMLKSQIHTLQPPLEPFITWLADQEVHACERTAVYAVADSDVVPVAMMQNLKFYQVKHENTLILKVNFLEQPMVRMDQQIQVEKMAKGIWRIVVNYGYKDEPDLPGVVTRLAGSGLPLHPDNTVYFLCRHKTVVSEETSLVPFLEELGVWRKVIFGVMHRNASSAVDYYCLPVESTVELTAQVLL